MELGIILLLVVPAAWAALLRWARCPGWSVVGGAVAGLVLGPTIFGRVLPEQYLETFVGGGQEHRALEELAARLGADRLVADHVGLDPAAGADLVREQILELEDAKARWRAASWEDQRDLRLLSAGLVALMLLGAAAFSVGGDVRGHARVGMLSIGAWSAALPAGIAFVTLRGFWDLDAGEALLAASAVAIGPWVLTEFDRRAADHAEVGGARLVQAAGRVATIAALATVAAAVAWQRPEMLGWYTVLAALVASWLIRPPPKGEPRVVREALTLVIVPAVTAAVAVKVDLVEDLGIWLVVVLLVLSGDGRWMGAVIGAAILGGRKSLRTMRLVLGSMAAGPTQLAVTALAVHTELIEPPIALALLLGAVLIEVTAGARRGVARRLSEAEEQLEFPTRR